MSLQHRLLVQTQPIWNHASDLLQTWPANADMMEEDDQQTGPGPSATAAATAVTSGSGPMSAAQKTTMGLVLRSMFLDKESGTHSVRLEQLVEKYNQKASVAASAAQIDQVHFLHYDTQLSARQSNCREEEEFDL